MGYDDCFTESDYAAIARQKWITELVAVRAEINSGTWTGAAIRLYELRQREDELESILSADAI